MNPYDHFLYIHTRLYGSAWSSEGAPPTLGDSANTDITL